jgi:hypothetical protein
MLTGVVNAPNKEITNGYRTVGLIHDVQTAEYIYSLLCNKITGVTS